MRGSEAPAFVLVEICVAVTILVILGMFLIYVVSSMFGPCWGNTLSEVKPIAEGIPILGLEKYVGRDEFTLLITLRSKCLDRIEFTTYKGCTKICGNQEDDFDGDVLTCLNECDYCRNYEGCIVAVPKTPAFFGDMGEWIKQHTFWSKLSIEAYRTEYTFDGDIPLKPPEEDVELACVDFELTGKEIYTISKHKVNKEKECDVSKLFKVSA
jgi:hypothetical protein